MVQKKRCKGWANVGGARIHSEEAVDCSCVVAAHGNEEGGREGATGGGVANLEKTAGKMGGAVALAVQRARCIRRRSVAGE
jgi:hypothetical protein